MKTNSRLILDACVLANFGVCDLLLRLAERSRMIVPLWSKQILEETKRAQVGKLHWPEKLADSFQRALDQSFPESCVDDYEHLLPLLANNEKDRHVLAAAIRSQASQIITFNLRHFSRQALAPWHMQAAHPQDCLLTLYEMEPGQVIGCLGEIAGRRRLDLEDIMLRLGKTLPNFASRILSDIKT
jgi:predicted nucleic acid-binding protein